MKKLMLGTVLCLPLYAQAKTCEVPINQVEVGSIKLMETYQDFKKLHPQAGIEKKSIFIYDTDYSFAREGVMSVGFIDYDSIKNRITAYSLSYNEGKYADLSTPLNIFKNKILTISKLPKSGWVLSKDKEAYQYTCDDYKVFIRQDNGVGRGSLGPVVWVFSRYSDSF